MSDIRQSLFDKIQADFTSSPQEVPFPALVTGYKDAARELRLAALEAASALPGAAGFVEAS